MLNIDIKTPAVMATFVQGCHVYDRATTFFIDERMKSNTSTRTHNESCPEKKSVH